MKARINPETLTNKDKVIYIPAIFVDQSVRLKFSYIALRNFLYYLEKGMRTQTKSNKKLSTTAMQNAIESYFSCHKEHNSLTDTELDLLKTAFTTKNMSVISSNDLFTSIEKAITFKNFTFFCNCFIELSFHVDNDYFSRDYILETVKELSNKMMVGLNDEFIDFIADTVLESIDLIK